MRKSVVIFASKYGSTREVAEAVGEGLGADVFAVAEEVEWPRYGLVVLGAPLYSGRYLRGMELFVQRHREVLRGMKVAAFVTAAADLEVQEGLTGEVDEAVYSSQDYAQGLGRMSGGEVVAYQGFGGRMLPGQLDAADRGTLEWFYRYLVRKPLEGFDLIDLDAARRWGDSLRRFLSTT